MARARSHAVSEPRQLENSPSLKPAASRLVEAYSIPQAHIAKIRAIFNIINQLNASGLGIYSVSGSVSTALGSVSPSPREQSA